MPNCSGNGVTSNHNVSCPSSIDIWLARLLHFDEPGGKLQKHQPLMLVKPWSKEGYVQD